METGCFLKSHCYKLNNNVYIMIRFEQDYILLIKNYPTTKSLFRSFKAKGLLLL